MKVYVITQGEYSDYHICGVAIDKERANRLAILYCDSYGPATIEEFDTEDVGFKPIDLELPPWKYYKITLYAKDKYEPGVAELYLPHSKDRPVTHGSMPSKYWHNGEPEPDPTMYYAEVVADAGEHALKIARDMYAKALAEYFNLC